MVLWDVVLFTNGGTATVPSSWFNKDGTLFWPPKNVSFTKALKEKLMPQNGWSMHKNVRVLISCGK